MSGSTYDLVKDHVEVKEFEPIKMKGKSEPIKVFGLLGVRDESSALVKKAFAGHGVIAKGRR